MLYMEVQKFESQFKKKDKTKAVDISLLGDCLSSTYKPLGSLLSLNHRHSGVFLYSQHLGVRGRRIGSTKVSSLT